MFIVLGAKFASISAGPVYVPNTPFVHVDDAVILSANVKFGNIINDNVKQIGTICFMLGNNLPVCVCVCVCVENRGFQRVDKFFHFFLPFFFVS